jgi:hypothetical protein
MTSRTRVLAARLAVRAAARGVAAGNLPACVVQATATALLSAIEAERRETAPERSAEALGTARTMVKKSKLARLLNGRGDLWNGADRAHQFALLNEAARVRRSTTLFYA